MDFGLGGSGGAGDKEQGEQGSKGLKRKWSDLEAAMTAAKDEVVKENAENSARIRRLMEENILLEKTVLRLENPSSFRGPTPRPNPIAAFSAEVWEMIIAKMNRLSDLEMLCLAFPELEPLVKKTKKTLFLFENVIPLVFKRLDWKDIIKCRLVCRKWNQDLCALLPNRNASNPHLETADTPVTECERPYELIWAYEFKDPRKIQNFLMKMANHTGNPFLGRFLRLTLINITDLNQFWQYALKLVIKFGEHIWNLEIDCCRDRADPITFYHAIRLTLIYLPNLRYFTVFVDKDLTAHGPSKTDMALQFESFPLPPLPYLQSFKLALNGETGMTGALSSLFSQQIRRLELVGKTSGSVDLKDERLRVLINLEHLEVELKSADDIRRLLKFPSSNLKKLCIHNDDDPGPIVPITQGEVADLMATFSRLEYLDLTYCRVERSSSLSSTMRFSRLKSLKVAVGVVDQKDDLQQNLDFLLWFPSLKQLVIKLVMVDIDKAGTYRFDESELDKHSTLKIRYHLFTRQVFDSNIWTLIPSLELLEIWGMTKVTGKYTREMFENRVG